MKELKLLLHGATGRMGKAVKLAATEAKGVTPVCGVAKTENFSDPNFPIYSSLTNVKEDFDVIIDFSSAQAIYGLAEYVSARRVPAVICTTGLTENDYALLKAAAKVAPVFICANASFGVAALVKLVTLAARLLTDYDAEIIETHHKNKADAPSGTALTLIRAIKSVSPNKRELYGRNPLSGKRNKSEIGVHSVRGGTAVGEHTIEFLGDNEVIAITHKAESRAVFATGAIKAALYVSGKKPGLYGMNDLT